jgi:hypothetical protein
MADVDGLNESYHAHNIFDHKHDQYGQHDQHGKDNQHEEDDHHGEQDPARELKELLHDLVHKYAQDHDDESKLDLYQ